MIEANRSIDTPLGPMLISAQCPSSDANQVDLRLDVVDLVPSVPPGMSVSRPRAVVLRLAATDDIPSLHWACTLCGDATGTGCNGEGLSAQEWEAGDHLVTVGTEDHAYLASRLPFLSSDDERDYATHWPKSLEVRLLSIPRSTHLSLHYAVADNPWPEHVAASSWFAVDVRHADLVALL